MSHKTDRLPVIPANPSNIQDLNVRLIHLIQNFEEVIHETDHDELLMLEQNLIGLFKMVGDATSMTTKCVEPHNNQIPALHIRSSTCISIDAMICGHNLLLNKERPLFITFGRNGISITMRWFDRQTGQLQNASLKQGVVYTLGRIDQQQPLRNVVPLLEPSISRLHASVLVEKDSVTIDDLGSSYGTFLAKKHSANTSRSFNEWQTLWEIVFGKYSVIDPQPFSISMALKTFSETLFEQPGTMLSGNFEELRETEKKLGHQVSFFESLFN